MFSVFIIAIIIAVFGELQIFLICHNLCIWYFRKPILGESCLNWEGKEKERKIIINTSCWSFSVIATFREGGCIFLKEKRKHNCYIEEKKRPKKKKGMKGAWFTSSSTCLHIIYNLQFFFVFFFKLMVYIH